jgi:GAF domain-containing protein
VSEEVRDPADSFAEMALSLHDERSFENTIERVLEFAVKELDCAYAGVIVVHAKDRIETVAATNPAVAELDQIQLRAGQGPDLEVIGDRHGVIVPDTTTEERWPDWAKLVAETGVRSMLGTRLYTTSQTLGSLNFYDLEPGHFSEADLDMAHALARHAAVALDSARTQDNLWRAIGSRHLIGVAQGILMERFAIDVDDAFSVLRRYSQDRNVRLHAVAEQVVESRRLPDEG